MINFKHCIVFQLSILFFVILIISCNGNNGKDTVRSLTKIIKEKLVDDNGISSEECEVISTFIKENGLTEYSDQATVVEYINSIAEEMSKSRRNPIVYPIEVNCSSQQKDPISELPDTIEYNVYIENSGSMFGYMKGNTSFKAAVLGLLTNINRYDEELNINFINDQIHPIKKDLDEFMNYLNPSELRKYGNISSSNLAQILKRVIEKHKKDDQTAILLSDFIFSIDYLNNTQGELYKLEHGITNIIHENALVERDFGFLIIKFSSEFDGNYYTFQNRPVKLDRQNRPYYIWIVGKLSGLKDFIKKYSVKELKGYRNHALIFSSENIKTPYYSILRRTNVVGQFSQEVRGVSNIKAIKKIDYSSRGDKEFQFCIAFDASKLPVEENYLKNRANYTVTSSLNDAFEIVSVNAVEDIDIGEIDRKFLGTASHLVNVRTSRISNGKQNLTIVLNKKIPKWVEESSSEDDSQIATEEANDKTFGFAYVIRGIEADFKPMGGATDKYFQMEVSLER